jgi:hypothetical protein
LLAEVGLAAIPLALLVQVGLVLAAAVVAAVPSQVEMAGVGVWEMGVLAARLPQMEIQGTRVEAAVAAAAPQAATAGMELLVVGEVVVINTLED